MKAACLVVRGAKERLGLRLRVEPSLDRIVGKSRRIKCRQHLTGQSFRQTTFVGIAVDPHSSIVIIIIITLITRHARHTQHRLTSSSTTAPSSSPPVTSRITVSIASRSSLPQVEGGAAKRGLVWFRVDGREGGRASVIKHQTTATKYRSRTWSMSGSPCLRWRQGSEPPPLGHQRRPPPLPPPDIRGTEFKSSRSE